MTKRYLLPALLALSAAGAAYISRDEGLGPTATVAGETVALAYPDPALGWGVPTICNGHTRGVFPGQRATLGQCEAWLIEDAGDAGRAIARCTPVEMTQGQYDALVSFVINVGGSAYCRSTLAKRINAGDCIAAGAEFKRWTRSGGRELRGLVRRRAGESTRWLADCRTQAKGA